MGQWLNILLPLLFIGVPLLTSAIKKINEQAAIRKERESRKRAAQDELRSTQVVQRHGQLSQDSPEESQRAAMKQLADRRQQQLRELRAKQMREIEERRATRERAVAARAAAGASVPKQRGPRPGQQQTGGTSGTDPRMARARQQQAQSGQAPLVARASQREQQRQQAQQMRKQQRVNVQEQRSRQEQALRKAQQEAREAAQARIEQARAAQAAPTPTSVRGMLFERSGKPRKPADIRRAIALTEVLAAPVSQRPGGPGTSAI